MAGQDPLAALGGVPATPAAQPTSSASTQDPLAALGGIPATAASAQQPQTLVSNIGGAISDAAQDVWGAAKNMVPGGPTETSTLKSVWDNLPPVQLVDQLKQTLPILDAYEKARSGGASIPDAIQASDTAARQHVKSIAAVQPVIDAFKANPTRETARAMLDASAAAAALLVGDKLLPDDLGGAATASKGQPPIGPTAAPVAAAPAKVSSLRINPFRKAIQDFTASPEAVGEATAQPLAQAGVRATAPTVGTSFRSGIDVQTPFTEAKALYRTVDDAAKTDFKGLYDKLDAAQDDARLAAPGSPEEARAQLNIKNTQDAIDDAKALAAKSGVSNVDATLKAADAKYTETQANKDFNSRFFGNNGVISGNAAHGAPETINVNGAIKSLETMDKPNKFGISRLQQTSLGPSGAAKLKQVLYDAQKAGQAAMDARAFRNTILRLTGYGAAALGAGETIHALAK